METEDKPAIFVFTTAYYPFIGGVEIAIQEIAERMKHQFRFFIITARLRWGLPTYEERPEGTVIRVGVGQVIDKWLLLFLGPLAALAGLRRTGVRRPLLWGMDISGGSAAAAILKLLRPGLPFVLTVQYGYGGGRLARGRRGLINFGYRFMLRRADAVTAISSFLAGTARQFGYRREVAIIPNGVALERFRVEKKRPADPAHPVVITASRLVPKNGVDTLIRAISEVRKAIPGIRCHILGDGPERLSLEALTHTLDLTGYVQFFGSVPPDDVPRHLAAADIFVRPSRSEGMGNAFVEALAAGVPIVGTPVEGILDIIKDGKTGLLARVDDPADVAEKTVRLLRDKVLSRRITDAGRALVRERFSWDSIAAGYAKVFYRAMLPRILVATPNFPPDIGGPGSYTQELAAALRTRGHAVLVLCYGSGDSRGVYRVAQRIPSGLKHLIYAFRAWQMLGRSNVALVLDPVVVGVPTALACRFRHQPMIIRVEGDFLWEWYTERTGEERTLRQFSEMLPRARLNLKEWLMYRLARRVFRQAQRLVFSSQWREEIFKLGYPMQTGQAARVPLPFPAVGTSRPHRERTLIFAGRFTRVKNLRRLIRAFVRIAGPGWRLELIGNGPARTEIETFIRDSGARDRIAIVPPLPRTDLKHRIAQAHAFLLPSLSDVSPNVILECMAAGTPFLLTRESGFYETLKDIGLFVDPLDEHDIAAKLRSLLDPTRYAAYRARLATFGRTHSWDQIAAEWLALIRSCL